MSEVSIAEAKNHLPSLVKQAEAGDVVRITRRGKQVAVLLSERNFERLATPGQDLAAFLKSWRSEMRAGKVEYPAAADFKNLRDNSERKPVIWE